MREIYPGHVFELRGALLAEDNGPKLRQLCEHYVGDESAPARDLARIFTAELAGGNDRLGRAILNKLIERKCLVYVKDTGPGMAPTPLDYLMGHVPEQRYRVDFLVLDAWIAETFLRAEAG